ncbi:MAG: tetratricopeptide repeat protein [Nitrospira sp.]|nr:tetratricopeptide repeat protein [Nitrospira sp.]
MKRGIIFISVFSILAFSLVPLSWATMPMPSNVDVTGCVTGKDFLLFGPHETKDYQRFYKYTINPCSNIPFDFKAYDKKVITANTALNLRDHHLVCPRDVKIVGPCEPVTFTGCVVDKTLFVFKTTFGSIAINAKEAHDIFRTVPIINDKEPFDLSPYEGEKIQLTGGNVTSQYFGIDSFTVVPKSMKVTGKCSKKESKLLSQTVSGYYRQKADGYKKEKKWQMALDYLNKAIESHLWHCIAYWERHDIKMNLNKIKEAVDDVYLFDKCEEGCANLEQLGDNLRKIGEKALASYAYHKALDLCSTGEKKEQLLGKLKSLGLKP